MRDDSQAEGGESPLCVGPARPGPCALRSGPGPRWLRAPGSSPRPSPHSQRSLLSCLLGPPQLGHLFPTLLALPQQPSPGKPAAPPASGHHDLRWPRGHGKGRSARGSPGSRARRFGTERGAGAGRGSCARGCKAGPAGGLCLAGVGGFGDQARLPQPCGELERGRSHPDCLGENVKEGPVVMVREKSGHKIVAAQVLFETGHRYKTGREAEKR